MNYREQPLRIACADETLVGVLAEPSLPASVGVLIVVGGPQYRAGSHRAFVLLARRLATEGVPVMRFDYRGMGDATGPARAFDEIDADIAAAIDAFCAACPTVRRVVLWGLCDAASAALIYWHATHDARVAGMVLVNPWVRSETGLARARLKHYYGRHLLEPEFWTRLIHGRVAVRGAVRDLLSNLTTAATRRRPPTTSAATPFQERMAEGLRSFADAVLLILSGRDLTAQEFLDYAQAHPHWTGLLSRENVTRHDMRDADHTFSSAQWRAEVEATTFDWLRKSVLAAAR